MERTDAHALHAILTAVTRGPWDSQPRSIQHAWASVIGDVGTVDFIRRHSEVVRLLDSTATQIAALPKQQTRDRFTAYIPSWWRAVVGHEWAWQSQLDPPTLIETANLDMLGSAADVLESHFGGTVAAPNGQDLTNLHEDCKDWIAFLSDEDQGIPAPLKQLILSDLYHLTWLMENVDLFGTSAVVRAAQDTSGNIAAGYALVSDDAKPGWSDKFKKLTATLLLITQFTTASTLAITEADHAAHEIGSVVAEVTHVHSNDVPPSAPEPPELEAPSNSDTTQT